MKTSHRFALSTTLLLAVTLLLAFTSTVPQAFAATLSPTRALTVQHGDHTTVLTNGTTVTFTKSFLVVAPNVSASEGGNTIACTATVVEGVASGDFVGQGEIICTENVAVISLSLLVYRSGSLYGSSSQSQAGVYYVYRDVVKACSSTKHSWQTYISGGVTFPVGYEPGSVAVDVGSAAPTYTC